MGDHVCCGDNCCPLVQNLQEMEFDKGIWNCAITGQKERLVGMLKRGIDVNKQDQYGFTALHYAARNGRLEICQTLLQNGADVSIVTRNGQATALHRAAFVGHSDILKLLCSYAKHDVIVLQDSDGQTCLHTAARAKQEPTYQWLFNEYPELIPIRDKNGKTAEELLSS